MMLVTHCSLLMSSGSNDKSTLVRSLRESIRGKAFLEVNLSLLLEMERFEEALRSCGKHKPYNC